MLARIGHVLGLHEENYQLSWRGEGLNVDCVGSVAVGSGGGSDVASEALADAS